jgi:hypothetical protein
MLLRNTFGFLQRNESTMYTILTGISKAILYVSINEDDDQVNTYICPGISITNVFDYPEFLVIICFILSIISYG